MCLQSAAGYDYIIIMWPARLKKKFWEKVLTDHLMSIKSSSGSRLSQSHFFYICVIARSLSICSPILLREFVSCFCACPRPQRASPGCFTVELSTCWPSSPLTGKLSLWHVRWWEPICCPFTPKRSSTLSRNACGGSVTAAAHRHGFYFKSLNSQPVKFNSVLFI